jgi:Transglycosylase-like domain/Putative peptidoglycan binding domain
VRPEAAAVRLSLAALVVCALLAAAGSASADDGRGASTGGGASAIESREVILHRGDRGPAVKRVQRRLRITAGGVFGRKTERAVKRFQLRKDLEPDGVVGPLTRRALRLRPFSRRSVYRRRRVRLPRVLRLIAECESGGNPRMVSSDGSYRGKWQFTRSTWRRLGGKGDPARAPEWLQDKLALKLYRQSGTEPWGACGRSASRG